MRKIIFFITLLFFLHAEIKVFASEPKYFNASYDVNYQTAENGITAVTYNIRLTNLTSDFYVEKYTVIIGEKEINNIEAFDRLGNLVKNIKKNEDQTEIAVTFNEKSVGINNSLFWTLRYSSREIAKKIGNIWEVNIPGLSPDINIDEYRLTLNPAPRLGKPAFIKPYSPNFSWDKATLEKGGVNIIFGQEQYYSFSLSYSINNPKPLPVISEVNLPADNGYQKIYLEEINPAPENIITDPDGNWLARYKLKPLETLKINVIGKAKTYFTSQYDNELLKKDYLSAQKYWESSDAKIAQIAQDLKTPGKIYHYVVNTLNYDYGRSKNILNRYGAKKILAEPNHAVCMEFTDLFIALSRAAGIPSREMAGYAYTQNAKLKPSELLHSWPEYYDQEKKKWIMVDLTWEKTTNGLDYFNTFDFNHLSFVVHGQESDYPYTPDEYKVNPIEIFPEATEQSELLIKLPVNYSSGLPINGSLQIVNKGNSALYNKKIKLIVDKGILETPYELYADVVPPRGYQSFNIKIKPTRLFSNDSITINAVSDRLSVSRQIKISPNLLLKILPLVIITLIIGLIFIIYEILNTKVHR